MTFFGYHYTKPTHSYDNNYPQQLLQQSENTAHYDYADYKPLSNGLYIKSYNNAILAFFGESFRGFLKVTIIEALEKLMLRAFLSMPI